VGTKTAGAVLVSVMAPLPDGWMLQYPMMDYLSAQGTRLEGTGVQPDVEAATPRYKEPDTAIEKAQALLSRTELREKRAAKSTPPPPEPAPVLDAA
jgi:C-terminal processing protease CtpA/Prc